MASDPAVQAQAELGWRWPVQQSLYDLLLDGEWTTFTDAAVLTEKVAEVLDREGYDVVKRAAPPTVVSFHRFESSRRTGLCTSPPLPALPVSLGRLEVMDG